MKYKKAFYTMLTSIKMDNGTEFVDQQALEASCLKIGEKKANYPYAHPYSKQQIKDIERWMNNYPRKLLGYQTASQRYRLMA